MRLSNKDFILNTGSARLLKACMLLFFSVGFFAASAQGEPPPGPDPDHVYTVKWVDLRGVTLSNDVLTKTATIGWTNAGAHGSNVLASADDGWLEFTVTTQRRYFIGFVERTAVWDYPNFNHAISITSVGEIVAWEFGTATILAPAVTGDVLRLAREGSQVIFYINGVAVRSVATDPLKTLFPRALICDTNTSTPVVTTSEIQQIYCTATLTGTSHINSTGSISLGISGGQAPYQILWSSGETTATITTKAYGTYQVTVTDADGATTTRTYNIGYAPDYIDLRNVTESSGRLTKPPGTGWNAGANTSNVLASNTDGWIEFIAPVAASGNQFSIGFGASFSSLHNDYFKYGFLLHLNQTFYCYEGTAGAAIKTWQPGDVFRIAREGTSLKYYHNGTVVRTLTAPSHELWVRSIIYSGMAPAVVSSFQSRLFLDANVTGTGFADGTGSISLGVRGGTAPFTYLWSSGETTSAISGKSRGIYSVTVTDSEGRVQTGTYRVGYRTTFYSLKNVTETDGRLSKPVVGAGWNAGANSQNVLPSNTDGWLEFVATSDATYEIGFGHDTHEFVYDDVKAAITLFHGANALNYYEGSVTGSFGAYLPGDVLRMERVGSLVYYYRNGLMLRSMTVDARWGLYVKVLLHSAKEGATPRVTTSFDAYADVSATVKGAISENATGQISLAPAYGPTPFSYSWSTGATTSSTGSVPRGEYTVNVTDGAGRVHTRTFGLQYRTYWSIIKGLVDNEGVLVRNVTPVNWTGAGAISYNALNSNTDGWIEFVADNTSSTYQLGFATNFTNVAQYNAFNQAFRLDFEYRIVYAFDNEAYNMLGTFVPGDLFRLAREGNTVKYYKNGVLLRTVSVASTPLVKTKAVVYTGQVPLVISSFPDPTYPGVVPDQDEFLALKDLFDATGGNQWTTRTNWPTTWPSGATNTVFKTWYGITVTDGDITEITLPSNNLVGSLPASINILAKLKKINFQFNTITDELPSLTGLGELTELRLNNNTLTAVGDLAAIPGSAGRSVYVESNKLDFGDLEPLFTGGGSHPFASLKYAPQSPVEATQTVTWQEGQPGSVTHSTPGTLNRYQWQKRNPNGSWSDLACQSQATLTREAVVTLDEGAYRTMVTNDKATVLTLLSPTIQVDVEPIPSGSETLIGIPEALKVTRDGRKPEPKKTLTAFLDLNEGQRYPVIQRPPCLDGSYYIAFELVQEIGPGDITMSPWDAQLAITLLKDNVELWTQPLSLSNNKVQTLLSTIFHDLPILCNQNYAYEVKRKAVTADAPADDIKLKIHFYKVETEPFDPAAPILLSCTTLDQKSELSWSTQASSVREYEIEWVFFEQHETISGTNGEEVFREKEPVRISTNQQNYYVQVYYPDGKLRYRIRAIGEDPEYPGHRIHGEWFYTDFVDIADHAPDKNWQLQSVFAEEGKYKKVMSYLDGTLRQRQTLTNLSDRSQTNTLVAESYYDFEGRKSIDVMAVPSTDSKLTYKPGFNAFDDSENGVLTKSLYDNGSAENSVLSQTVGAGKYFSPANDRTATHKDFIPDADGYAYSQTEYLRDGTGRVNKQGGVGESFRIDGPHATRYYYGNVTQEELVRLFGNNAGKAARYKKNLVVDANGQVIVTYMDQGDRVIATALAGNAPENVEALPSLTSLSTDPLTVDITSKNVKSNGLSTTSHKLLNTSPQTYTFLYDLAAYGSDVVDMGCQTCYFDLTITITNPEGQLIDLSGVTGNESEAEGARPFEMKGISAADCLSPSTRTVQFGLTLTDLGDYTITKTVRAHELTYEQVRTIVTQAADVITRMDQVRESYVVDTEGCEICADGQVATDCPDTEAVINEAMGNIATQDCENILRLIMAELEPVTPDAPVTQEEIELHPNHCHYELCMQNKNSDVFEKQLTRIETWTAAVANGYNNLVNTDPFFNESGLSGVPVKSDMVNMLSDILVATISYDDDGDGDETDHEFRGTLDQVTDPSNTAMQIDEYGDGPADGKHVLYLDLMTRRATIGEEAYQAELDKQRWLLYKSFYLEAKRLTILSIADYQACPAARVAFEMAGEMNDLDTEQEIIDWGRENGLQQGATEEDIATTVYSIQTACGTTLSETDKQAISTHLAAYFGRHPEEFFHVISIDDLNANDPDLQAVQTILAKPEYGCSLQEVAVTDPVVCVEERIIEQTTIEDIPDPSYSGRISTSGSQDEGTDPPYPGYEEVTFDDDIGIDPNSAGQIVVTNEQRQCDGCPLASEYEALMKFYESTGGPEWARNTGWHYAYTNSRYTPMQLNGWSGITTNSEGSVAEINLRSNNLTGTIPPDMNNLAFLMVLDLLDNDVTGSTASISGLTNLVVLDLYGNLRFPEGTETLDGFSTLQYIQRLNLTNCRFTGEIPPSFLGLSFLTHLYIKGNSLTGNLTQSLSNLNDDLIALDLSNNGFSGTIPALIGGWSRLEYLALGGNNDITGPIPASIGNLAALTDLILHDCSLNGAIPPEVSGLVSLRSLVLRGNSLTGQVLTLSQLVNLSRLDLANNQLDGNIPDQFANTPDLQYLGLNGNQLVGGIPASIQYLQKLTYLSISNNPLANGLPPTQQHTIPTWIGALMNLEYFSASECGLTGAIPNEVTSLTKLLALDLHNNDLTQLPSELSQIIRNPPQVQYYRHIDLSGNRFGGSIPPPSGPIDGVMLDFSRNSFSGSIDTRYSTSRRLEVAGNQFTFENLLPVSTKLKISSTYYSPQAPVGQSSIVKGLIGSRVTLTAVIDRDVTNPYACKYQWFKLVDGVEVPVNTKSSGPDGYKCQTPELTEADNGTIYYYKIWNDALTGLTLISRHVTLQLTAGFAVCTTYSTETPTVDAFIYTQQEFVTELVARCLANAAEEREVLVEAAIEEVIEEEVTEFYAKYETNCLNTFTESLTYTYVPKEYHYTLYYFDQSGNLTQTVPPNGVKPLSNTQVYEFIAGTNTTNPAHELLTEYKYNSLNGLTWQRTPDAGVTQFWYNEKGQLRFSQNAKQYGESHYSYTRYDEQGRIIEVGELTSTDVAPLLAQIEDLDFPLASDFTLTDVTRTHYDLPTETALPEGFAQNNLRTRVAWVEVEQKDRTGAVATYYDYDVHGNVRSLLQKIPGLDFKRTDYVYDLVSSKVNYVMYQYGYDDQFIHHYTYDPDNRIRQVFTSSDGFIFDRDADYYYYLHGPLARVELGEHNVQGQDYYYTLQGWIKGVNMPYDGDPMGDGQGTSEFGRDVYAYALGYYNGDYRSITASVAQPDSRDRLWSRYDETYGSPVSFVSGLFNGNIAWMETDLANFGKADADRADGMQGMVYRYDQLNRIFRSRSLKNYDPLNGFPARTADGAYDENYTYDPNGNILTLQRRDDKATLKDNWQYTYYTGTNRLMKVDPAASVTYEYDAIGNLITDHDDGTTILWTPYGKVHEVHRTDGSKIKYRYDAMGNRVEKQVEKTDQIENTNYVRDASGNVMAVYKDTKAIEHSIYGSERLGVYNGGRRQGDRTLGQKTFELSNHLGNVLAVITDNVNRTEEGATATVTKVGDYYPFGLDMPGRVPEELEEIRDDASQDKGMQEQFPGLVSHHALDANGKDQTGHLADGVVTGATPTSDAAGVANKAMTFDGNDYINLPNSKNQLSFVQNTARFTIAAYVKFSDLTARSTILSTIGASAGKGFTLMFENATTAPYEYKYLRFFSTWGTSGSLNNVKGEQSRINDLNWHHVAVVGDGRVLRLYIDGQPDGPAVNVTGWSTGVSSRDAAIGAIPDLTGAGYSATTEMNGAIDDLYVFDRALSGEELQKLVARTPLADEELVTEQQDETLASYRYGFNGKEKDQFGVSVTTDPGTCVTCGELRIKLADLATQSGDQALLNISAVTTYLNTALGKTFSEAQYQQAIAGCDLTNHHLNFNGNSYITFGDQPQYKMGTSDFTIEAWVKYPSTIDNGLYPIVSNQEYFGSVPNFSGINFAIFQKQIYFILADGSNYSSVRTTTLPTGNVWHHVVVQRVGNRAADMNIFVDGVEVPTFVEADGLTDGDIDIDGVEPLKIGSRAGSYDNASFKGELKQVRMYKRLLSSQEVVASYNYGCGTEPADPTALVLWVPLNEGAGTSVRDLSSFGQTSVLVGTNLTWKGALSAISCVNGTQEVLCTSQTVVSNVQYDYGFRIYNPQIAKFLSVDPLAGSYPMLTPYQFASNSPIASLDLDGQEAILVQYALEDLIFNGGTKCKKFADGFIQRGIETVEGTIMGIQVAKEVSQFIAENYPTKLAINGDYSQSQYFNEVMILMVHEVGQKFVQEYADLIERAASGDAEATGALTFEVVMLAVDIDELRHLRGLRGLSQRDGFAGMPGEGDRGPFNPRGGFADQTNCSECVVNMEASARSGKRVRLLFDESATSLRDHLSRLKSVGADPKFVLNQGSSVTFTSKEGIVNALKKFKPGTRFSVWANRADDVGHVFGGQVDGMGNVNFLETQSKQTINWSEFSDFHIITHN